MKSLRSNAIAYIKSPQIWIPISFGIVYSVLNNYFNWDLNFQALFWNESERLWEGKRNSFSLYLYKFSLLPAIFTAITALFIWIFSYSIQRLIFLRKIAIYLFLVLALGNGLIVNGLFKEFWGRPRPAQIENFSGTQIYEPSLWIDTESYGKSFPCGHATMGFYFYSLALLANGPAQIFSFLFATIFGLIIGIGRSSMGGHFLSDTIWAGILLWLTSKALYDAFNFKKRLYHSEKPPMTRKEILQNKLKQFLLVPLLMIFILSVLLASPRDKTHSLEIPLNTKQGITPIEIQLDLRGILYIETQAENFSIHTHGKGFGFPKSKLITKIHSQPNATIKLEHKVEGFFSELNADSRLLLKPGYRYKLDFNPKLPDKIFINSQLINTSEATLLIDGSEMQ